MSSPPAYCTPNNAHTMNNEKTHTQWTPEDAVITDIFHLVQANCSADLSNEERHHAYARLASLEQSLPELACYLALVFSTAHLPQVTIHTRHTAGLFLKNVVLRRFRTLPDYVQTYTKARVLDTLADSQPCLRRTAGTIVSAVVSSQGLSHWVSILEYLLHCLSDPAVSGGMSQSHSQLDHSQLNHSHSQLNHSHSQYDTHSDSVDGALDTLLKLCEDSPDMMLDQQLNVPFSAFFPRLVALLSSPLDSYRERSLDCIKQFWTRRPQCILQHLDALVSALLDMSNDTSQQVRHSVCQSLVIVTELHWTQVSAHLQRIMQCMLQYLENPQEDTDLQSDACQFFTCYCEHHNADLDLLWRHSMHRLVPTLLRLMRLSEYEQVLAADADDPESNSPQAMRPQFHRSRGTNEDANENDSDDGNDSDNEEDTLESVYTVRKAAAKTLDTCAVHFRERLLTVLLPAVDQCNASSDWVDHECAVLALGAVSAGCAQGMTGHLPGLVAHMIQQLVQHRENSVRTICCWTLGRYADWVLRDPHSLQLVLSALMQRTLEHSTLVQRAACTALAQYLAVGGRTLCSALPSILDTLLRALRLYGPRNRTVAWDTLGECAECMGELMRGHCAELVSVLLEQWLDMDEGDRATFHLMECIGFVARALGEEFTQWAPEVLGKALHIAGTVLEHNESVASDQDAFAQECVDNEFAVCALDLVSFLLEGCGSQLTPLLQSSHTLVYAVLLKAIASPSVEVRQSGLAVFGELVTVLTPDTHTLQRFSPLLLANLDPLYASVCNNASWVLGQIAMHSPTLLLPVLPSALQHISAVLNTPRVPRHLLSNLSITLGRLARGSPQHTAPHLAHFFRPWALALGQYPNDGEKADAFRGMLGALSCAELSSVDVGALLFCVGMWGEQLPVDTEQVVGSVLSALKQFHGESWEILCSQCPQDVCTAVLAHFRL